MTPPSILDLAKAALADRDRGTPGPWIEPDEFRKSFGSDGEQVALANGAGESVIEMLWYDGAHLIVGVADAEIIAAARTREPLLAAEVVRLTEVAECYESARTDLAARLADAERERDEARKTRDAAQRPHPCAPARCPACEWTNVGLLNYGTTGESRWLCHGCAATALADTALAVIADAATLRAANAELASELVELRKRVMSVAQERVIQAAVEWRDAAPEEESVEGRAARITSGWHLRRAVDALAKEPGQ